MLGFEAISGFTHEIESFFDSIRSGQLVLDNRLLALMLKAKDHIALLVSQGLTPSQQAVFASRNSFSKSSNTSMRSNPITNPPWRILRLQSTRNRKPDHD